MIKSFREKYNLSQRELGKMAGVSRAAISKYELGLRKPRKVDIYKFISEYEQNQKHISSYVKTQSILDKIKNFINKII